MFSFLAEHADGRTLPFLQYVATMAAVDAIQECADEALAEAAAAHNERVKAEAATDETKTAKPARGVTFRRGSGRSVDVRVKWPNDLYSGGVKIGGVLCTSTYAEGAFDVVVGVGINLDNDAPTTCVNAVVAAAWDALLNQSQALGEDANDDERVKVSPRRATRERLTAIFMNRFEALCGLLNASGGFDLLEAAYLRQWLHTDQKVVLEEGEIKTEVTVRGLTKSGYLLADDASGARFELHPDGNSFDFFQGLVRKKLS
jgi:biotin--protein ligase